MLYTDIGKTESSERLRLTNEAGQIDPKDLRLSVSKRRMLGRGTIAQLIPKPLRKGDHPK
jgi:hypothetical protein